MSTLYFHRSNGFTLVEMVVVIAIALVLTNLAIPSMMGIHKRSQATSMINWIIGAVHYTRHAAVTHRVTTTLCPSISIDSGCGGEWHDGVIVFLDYNKDAIINGKDRVILKMKPDVRKGTMKWRSFRNRKFLQMTEFGHTNYQNGNFTYCSDPADQKFSRQIIINVQGRVRVINRRNDEGVLIDRKNKPLRC